jgi:hypothetical protein
MKKFHTLLVFIILTDAAIFVQAQLNSIAMSTPASEVKLKLAGTDEATIDWGDGKPNDRGMLRNKFTSYTHCFHSRNK